MTVWILENSRLTGAFEGEVVGRSGTKAETMLEMRPVLLAASTARMAKYLWRRMLIKVLCHRNIKCP